MPSQSKGPRASARHNGARPKPAAHPTTRKAATTAKSSTPTTSPTSTKPATSTAQASATAKAATATATATKVKPTATASRPVVRGVTTERLSKRDARAARRAAERRRRNTIAAVAAAVLVVAAFAWVLKSHLPAASSKAAAKSTAVVCPTATTVVGPTVQVTPAPKPPALPAGAKTVDASQGLQYVDITSGCGRAVQNGDNVVVNYTGWLQSNGTEFDSSLGPGKTPFEVDNVGQAQVITGWNMGLVGMKVGGTRRLIIPAALAYGSSGSGPIPANATLIFDITVVGFK